jgi:hypothetical protein
MIIEGSAPWPMTRVIDNQEFRFMGEMSSTTAEYQVVRVPCTMCGQMTVALDTKKCHDCDTVERHLHKYMETDAGKQFVRETFVRSIQRAIDLMNEQVKEIKRSA